MSNDPAKWGFETAQIHAGAAPDPTTNSRATPIYQTTAYTFNSSEHAAKLFGLAEFGNIYTRIMNPTQDVAEKRIAALEGGTAALLLASGQAAETLAILNIAQAGDHIVSSSTIYGGTYNLIKYTLPKLGIETTFVEDQDDLKAWAAAVRPNTKLFFAETIGNPKVSILDIEGVADVAHKNGVPLIGDNTVATPDQVQPLKHGADIVIHSATKFLGGHGTVVAGAIVSFEIKGGRDAGSKFVDSLELFSHVANIGDVRSLVIHPASTTHSQLTPEQQVSAGVTPGLVRLSVGLESVDDLIADLKTGFEAAKK